MTTVARTNDEVRAQVSDAYKAAITQARGCCGGGTACGDRDALAGVAAKLAGYGEEAREHAEVSSFGCGNPLAFAGVEAGQTVLDLGSGAGFDLLIAAKKVGPEGKVIGVDMTDSMIEAARKNAARAGYEQIEIRKGIIEEMPVEDASVDWVISNCVINLSPEKERVFSEIHRVLRPGGRFSISDIVTEELPAEIRQHAAAYAACVAGAISEASYVAGLEKAGLVDVEVAERLVYSAAQIRELVGSDLESFGIDPSLLDGYLDQLEGKVWSAKLTGRRPL
jgi:SAM-dependent methyltransferase